MPLVPDRPTRYRAFLLRRWESQAERRDQPGTWRFSLECVQTKENRGLDGLEGLVSFLKEELEANRPAR